MKIAILTSGGDSSGMNPAIKSFAEHCLHRDVEPFGVYDGLEGLIDGAIEPLTPSCVSGIIHRGGTILRSSRSKRFLEAGGRAIAAEQLRSRGIQHLVMLGGDGSFRAMRELQRETDIEAACIPATIDNDITGSDYCLGVDSALNVIRTAIDSIRDTAASFRRAFVVETMGRHCGYLAIASAITSGAEICLAPELEFEPESVIQRLRNEIKHGRRYAMAIVSEAITDGTAKVKTLLEGELGLDTRITVLGHTQRGGSPSFYDRRMANTFATEAVDALLDEKCAVKLVCRGGEITTQPLDDGCSQPIAIAPSLLKLAQRLAC